jgi:CelD/BcsL family acetyltransferase involved in cellulose biosynthesis
MDGVPTGQVTVERIDDVAQLSRLVTAWDELIDAHIPGAVFRSTAWLLPWWEHFGSGKKLSVYTVRAGARLLGLLPAYRIETTFGGQRLRLLGDEMVCSDYLGVVARPAELKMVSNVIARALVHEESDVALNGLSDDEPLVLALAHAAQAAGATFSRYHYAFCPIIPIPTNGAFDAWLRQRPSGSGAHLLRQRRRLERQTGFRLETLTDECGISERLPLLWNLHRARWAAKGRQGAISDPRLERFHAGVARELARRGWARLFVLYVDGAPRAALYGFQRDGRFAYYQSGSDPTWGRWSVGTAVLGLAIEDAFARGLREFDFLRGDEAYKHMFASSRRGLVRLRVVSGGHARALLAISNGMAGTRRLARELLPPRAVDWIRRYGWRARR